MLGAVPPRRPKSGRQIVLLKLRFILMNHSDNARSAEGHLSGEQNMFILYKQKPNIFVHGFQGMGRA